MMPPFPKHIPPRGPLKTSPRQRVLAQWRGVDLAPLESARAICALRIGDVLPKVAAAFRMDSRRAEIEARGPERTTRLGGAGGSREVRAFDYGPVTLSIGGRAATVERLSVLPDRTIERSRFVYGDIGQDVIRQFEAMTLDFRRMRIRFR